MTNWSLNRGFWTADKVQQLHHYYIELGLPASETARIIGAQSRNAVIGQAHRKGWRRSAEIGRQNSRAAHPSVADRLARRAALADRNARIFHLYVERGLGALTVAALVNMGDAAVRAVVKRKGWGGLKGAPSPAGPARSKTPKPPTIIELEKVAQMPGSEPRHWMSRRSGECAWPVSGDGADTFYCCGPVHPGSSWCPGHHRIGHSRTPFGIYRDSPAQLAARVGKWAA